MPRNARYAPGGYVYHVLNRGVGRQQLFFTDDDYLAFERVLGETLEKRPLRVLGYCLMPNHWHMVLWPEADGDLGAFMQRLTVRHVTRWQRHHRLVGQGHVYQGRFKSFPVATDEYFYQLMRYVERNALRANLVKRAEEWPWGSLWIRKHGSAEHRALLSDWPLPRPRRWVDYVNQPASDAELAAIRRSSQRGSPYGPAPWVGQTAKKLGLESTLRSPGRPKKTG
ncbi:Transposase IS200 like protein [Posidoniimonas polymericola]|uniref:Transposase IS200 like protein n=1 Tax=Posidoniimonas polymericola TaxID=2528002 RepID=A0A5C5YRX6_9BACT|nr:transposase [Posidoniimonas polymericola]TWT77573.1 Transposase IS200 like protein [Posidoniimonas polymericola]